MRISGLNDIQLTECISLKPECPWQEEVRAAIARARPLIAGFDGAQETVPVGGIGLPMES
jgi:hypothetical protein